jgi:hypothetical protein
VLLWKHSSVPRGFPCHLSLPWLCKCAQLEERSKSLKRRWRQEKWLVQGKVAPQSAGAGQRSGQLGKGVRSLSVKQIYRPKSVEKFDIEHYIIPFKTFKAFSSDNSFCACTSFCCYSQLLETPSPFPANPKHT